MNLEEILAELEALKTQAADAVANKDATAEESQKALEEITAKVEALEADKEKAEQAKALADTQAALSTLEAKIEETLRKPSNGFVAGEVTEGEDGKAVTDADDPYKPGSGHSPWADVKLANRGNQKALERLTHGMEGKGLNEEGKAGKAMTEGTNSQGGYLVRPTIERQLVLARESDNVLRGLCTSITLDTNSIQLDQLGVSTSAGWVAEQATKPESTSVSLASITANVFTAAGLVTITNQLLADANPAIDQLVTDDLAKRIVALEETAFLNGSGSGQPLGILQTGGIGTTTVTPTDVPTLLDKILEAISTVESNHGAPSAILMHPRTWTRILQSKDLQGAYYVDPTGGVQDPRTGIRGPVKLLWGVPVITSNRIPTNLGAGTNESRVIVGDFKEALILDRQGITVDDSSHVYFTTNQTVFRVEERVGFTAARVPAAFNVLGGAGLAAG